MESKPKYRETYERKSVIIGRILAKLGFTPTMMTVSSIIIAGFSLYYFFYHDLLLALLILVIAGIFDIFDGAIARATGKASKYGTVLDNTADRIVEAILLMGLALGGYVRGWIAILTLLAMFLPSYIRARGEAELGVRALGVGLFERKEKLGTLYGSIILAWYLGNILLVQYSGIVFNLLEVGCLIVTLGSLITAVQRLIYFKNK